MAEPRWLSAEETRAWQAFLAVAALLDRRPDQQLKEEARLSHPQYEILVRLAAAPDGELPMTDLAGALYTSKSGLPYQVAQLEKAGLVRRTSSPVDVRGVVAARRTRAASGWRRRRPATSRRFAPCSSTC
jgi:DNA-binding MarR family transcriptional regulator